MGLEIRKSSKWWYATFVVDGRKSIFNLGVAITGKRPPKRTMLGDDEFERSRGRAQEAYRVLERKMCEDRTGEKSLKKLAEMKTGQPVSFPKLADLPALWQAIPRRKAPAPVYARGCKQRLAAFADFAARFQRGVRDFVEVKPDTAKAFMAAEEKRGVAPKSDPEAKRVAGGESPPDWRRDETLDSFGRPLEWPVNGDILKFLLEGFVRVGDDTLEG